VANLDTQLKRASSVQILLMSLSAPQFPTATFTQAIRQAIAHTYAGIAAVYTGASMLLKMMLHSGG